MLGPLLSTARRGAFTLVEILIVVVILGILAAMVVPQFVGATKDAQSGTAFSELAKVRRALDVYLARHENALPTIVTGDGPAAWGPMIGRDYLKEAPLNPYVPGPNQRKVLASAGAAAPTAYSGDYAWIYNTTTGDLWAGGFGATDEPFPKP
jgi:general secretion pathway protein G